MVICGRALKDSKIFIEGQKNCILQDLVAYAITHLFVGAIAFDVF